MAIETTYTSLRQGLSAVLDRVVDDREVIVVRRKKKGDVALIAADELASLLETAHLLRSPKNAARLLDAFRDAKRGKGKPQTVESLRTELGL